MTNGVQPIALTEVSPGQVFRVYGKYYCLFEGKYYTAYMTAPGNFVRGKQSTAMPTVVRGGVQVVGRLRG